MKKVKLVGLGNMIMEVGYKVFETENLYNELIDTLEYFKFEYENKADINSNKIQRMFT